MNDSASADLAPALEPDPRPATPGVIASPLVVPASAVASPGALGALASPQRAQAVAALQRGHGNAAVANLLSPTARAGSRVAPAMRPPGGTIGAPDGRAGASSGVSRRDANAALARIIAADVNGAETDRRQGQHADESAPLEPGLEHLATVESPALVPPEPEPEPDHPATLAPDPAHDFALSAPGSAAAASSEEAAHDAASPPEPNAHSPPIDELASSQAPPLAVNDVEPQAAPPGGVGPVPPGSPPGDLPVTAEPIPPPPAAAAAVTDGTAEPPAPDASIAAPAASGPDLQDSPPAPGPSGEALDGLGEQIERAGATAADEAATNVASEAPADAAAAAPPAAPVEPELAPASDGSGGGDGGSADALLGPTDESVMVVDGADTTPAASPASTPPTDTGQTVDAIALEQTELIKNDAAMSEGQVEGITAANRQRVAGEFGEVRQGLAALLAGSAESVHSFIAGRQAEVRGAASSVLASAQGVVTGAVQAAQANAAQARDTITTFVAGVSESLRARVQGIATQITGALGGISLPDIPGVSALLAAANGLVGRAASAVTGGLGHVQNLIGSAVGAGTQIVSSLLANLGQLATSALTQVSGAIERGVQAAAGMLNRVADMVLGSLRTFISAAVLPVVNQVEGRLVAALGTAREHAVSAIRSNRDEHLQALASANGGAAQGTGATPEVADALTTIGQEAVQNDRAIVQTYEQRTSSTLGSIFQAIASGAARVVEHVAGVVSQAIAAVTSKVSAIVEGLQQIVSSVRTFVQSLLQEAASVLTGAVEFVRSLVEDPVRQLIDFASGAWNRLTGFVGGLVRRVLSGDFGIPSLSEVIGEFRPSDVTAGPITKPRPGPITLPELLGGILLAVALFGALVVAVFPELAVVIAALVALGLSPAVAYLILGLVAIVVLVLALILLYLLYKLLTSKPKKPKDPKPTIEHETDFSAPDGSPKTRTSVGVAERVVFTGSAAGTWTSSAGTPGTASGKTFPWRAPQRADTVTVTLQVGTNSASVSLSVLEPDAIAAIKLSEETYPAGTQGAGMKLDFQFQPLKASFGNAETREVSGPASDIKGYYLKHGMPHDHNAGAPGNFFRIAENNQFAKARDRAAQAGYPDPWDDGSFHWIIPNKFRTIFESGDGKQYTTVKQEFIIDPTGKTKITKAGAAVERTP